MMHWSSSVNSQEEWNLYDASGERVLRRTYDEINMVLTVFAFGVEEYAYLGSGGDQIRNAGINDIPRAWDSKTGLSRNGWP